MEKIIRCLGFATTLSAVGFASSTPVHSAAQQINGNTTSTVTEQGQQYGRNLDSMQNRSRYERMLFAAEALRALHEENLRFVQSLPTTDQEIVLPLGNPLEGTDAPRCLLGNGVTIQTSGGFHPSHPSADCKN
jgi:hypothetical protein